jgi:DNA-binding XRE family transcriptional regulator
VLSQQELADAVGAARQTISGIERGAAREATFDESAREELVDAQSIGVARRA